MEAIKQSEFQFTNPLLMEMHFSINKEYLAQLDDDALSTPLKMNVTRKDTEESDANTAFVLLSVDVGKDGADFPYHIAVTMGANFRWTPSLPKDMVEPLLSRNAPALLLGYIRPYIAQITEASPVGAVHIPYMNFAPQD